jgi:tetratricopeptide (TPR) repeat protein
VSKRGLLIVALMAGGAGFASAQEVQVQVVSKPEASQAIQTRVDPSVAFSLLKNGRIEEGRKQLLAIASSGGADAKVFYNLAIAEMRSGLLKEAMEHATKAAELSKGSWKPLRLVIDVARRHGALEQARMWLDQLHAKLGDSIAVDNASARLEVFEGKAGQALKDVSQILKKDETNGEAMKTLVLAYLAMNRVEAAEIVLNQLLEGGKDGELLDMAADLAIRAGEKRKAIALLEQAVGLEPSLVDAHVTLGYLYYDAGDYEASASEFQAALVWDTVNLSALVGLGNAYRKMQNYDKAIVSYQQAIKQYPDCADCYFDLAVAFLENKPAQQDEPGHYKKALEHFQNYKQTYRGAPRRDDPVDKYMDEARRMLDYVEKQGVKKAQTKTEQAPAPEPPKTEVQPEAQPDSSTEGEKQGEGLRLK